MLRQLLRRRQVWAGLFLCAGGAFQTAMACPYRTHAPALNDLQRYSQIHSARVVSIEWDNGPLSRSDLTPSYRLTLSDVQTLQGPELRAEAIAIGSGCGWPWPQAGRVVILFVEKSAHLVVPLYDDPQGSQLKSVIAALPRRSER